LKLYYSIIDASNETLFSSSVYRVDPQSFSVYRFNQIHCLSPFPVDYDLVDTSISLTIDSNTGQLSSTDGCPQINEFLVRCSERSVRQQVAYAKIRFDRICQENSVKQSSMDWINRIGDERRKRIHYQSSSTVQVSDRIQTIDIVIYRRR
jgi:hypothetical protein